MSNSITLPPNAALHRMQFWGRIDLKALRQLVAVYGCQLRYDDLVSYTSHVADLIRTTPGRKLDMDPGRPFRVTLTVEVHHVA